jgi:GntR family transcriptional regulator
MTTIEASLAAQGRRVRNRLLEFGQAAAPEWGRGLGLDEAGPLRLIRRLKLVDDSPWALETRLIPAPVADRFSRTELAEESIFELFKRHDDIRVCRVAYTITGAALDHREAEELAVRPGALALFRAASYHNRTEALIMLGRVVFLAERTALRYEFRREDKNWGIVEVV